MSHSAESPTSPAQVSPPSVRSLPKLGRVQAWSGVVFAAFLVLHLVTTISGLFGIASYDGTLSLLRHLYRPHLVVELTVIGLSGTVHLTCAVLQMIRRRKVFAVKGPWWMKAHRLSGYFLFTFVLGHVFATRIAPMLAVGETATGAADYSFLAFATLAVPLFFWPYYLLLGLAGALHLGLGLHLASRVLGLRSASGEPGPSRGSGSPNLLRLCATFGFTILVLAGVLGILLRAGDSPRQRFPEYRALQHKLLS